MSRKRRSAWARVPRAPWAVVRLIGKILRTALTVLLVGVAAAFGGRIRIEDPPPKNPVVQVEKEER
jgi:hypothetical protein